MLGGITTFNFDWLLWRTKPCMLAGVFLVSASVPKRCLSSPFLLYFSLIHIYYRISFLLLPLLCRASGFSWSYSRLSFLNRKIVQLKVCDPESLLSAPFPPIFFLICASHHISFLMTPVLCRASRYSLVYGRLRF